MKESLREYAARLERAGELVRIDVPVDPVFEMAEIIDRVSKSPGGGKALWFEHTGTSFPVLANLYGSERRMALALGAGSLAELAEGVETMLMRAAEPKNSLRDKLRMLPLLGQMSRSVPRRMRGRGACQQVVRSGEEASLAALPVLGCWPCDGGRFVTLPMVHTLDPDTGVRNVGMYRMQLFDARTTGMHWQVHKTGARHYAAYRRLGRRMPVTVTLGGDPVYAYAATAPLPDNMDEYLLAGFLRRRPVRLVKCLTNDLYVPEDCDFVIEGYVDPQEAEAVEGPFGDHTGFYSLEDLYPRFHVTAITHRRDAVYPATVVGIPPQEDAYIAQATERLFLAPLRLALGPEVADLTLPVPGVAHNLAVAAVAARYAGQALKVAQGMWGAGQMMCCKYLILVPAECDVRDAAALARRIRMADPVRCFHPAEGVYDVLDHATATPGFGGKVAFDLTDEAVVPLRPVCLPASSEGVRYSTDYLETWGVVVAFAGEDAEPPIPVGAKYFVVFDREAGHLTGGELLWLAAANTDPRRDAVLRGTTLCIDARAKRPGLPGHPARFPNPVASRPEIIERVDRRWEEYGIGPFVASPSLRYRGLQRSDEACW